MPGRLILLCGVAGAGKTTLAKQLEANGAVRMCPDEWLVALGFDIYDRDGRFAVEMLQWSLSQRLLLKGLTVVDECGVWQRRERDQRRSWARDHGVAVELRFLDAPVAVLTARVEARNRALPEGAPHIDPRLVAYWADRIERPDPEELSLYDSPPPAHRWRTTGSEVEFPQVADVHCRRRSQASGHATTTDVRDSRVGDHRRELCLGRRGHGGDEPAHTDDAGARSSGHRCVAGRWPRFGESR